MRHKPIPPLCKAPEAAVQRRCGDRLRRWRDCQPLKKSIICMYKPTTPQSPNGASSTKARLRMPQALLRCPYTGEPIEVRTNLIQCHRPMPPLCKGRGTTSVVEGLSKSLCKAPEAAVQRRCGDRPWRWRDCKRQENLMISKCRPTTPQSPTLAALPRHAYVCRRPTTPQTAYAASSPYTGEPI